MRTEDLDQTDLEGRDLAVHEDTREIQLDLEADVDVRAVDCWTPPQREPTVGNLVQTGPLCVRELLVSHRLLETRRLLPEKTLPGGEVSALEQGVLEDTLNTTQGGDNVHTVVVKLPQLAVVTLRRPPEGVVLQELILLPVRPHSPTPIISKSMSVLLEECIDTRDTTIPTVF